MNKDELVLRKMQEIVNSVPDGNLSLPEAFKRKKTKYQIIDIPDDAAILKENVNYWPDKTFIYYFAHLYKKYFNTIYKITFAADMKNINKIFSFFLSIGLNRKEYTKKFIEWAFKNKDFIIKKSKYFTTTECAKFVNYFYQDEILPNIENGNIKQNIEEDIILLEEIEKLEEEEGIVKVFENYGIVITTTFLINYRNGELNTIVELLNKKFEEISKSNINLLEKIFHSTIIRSPYPENFLLLNWREVFDKYTKLFNNEKWWRDKDYNGKPLIQYYNLVKEN